MEHEREFIGETKGEQQERINTVALERLQGNNPAIGSSEPRPQSAIIKDSRATMDAGMLSWGGGEPVVGPGGMTPEEARVAAVGPYETLSSTPAAPLDMRSAPDCSAGLWSMSDILKGGK
jgi:hypothetical protein